MGLLPPSASVAGQRLPRRGGHPLRRRGQRQPAPLEGHRHGLPGRDERVQPREAGRRPDRGADEAPRDRRGPPGAAAGRRAPRARRHPGRAGEQLPARVLGRHAPARRDRDVAGVQAADPARRRADDGARRDGAGADPRSCWSGSPTTSGSRSSSSPTTCPSWPRSASVRRSCTRARSSRRGRPTRSTTTPVIPTRASSSRPRPTSTATDAVVSIPGTPPRLDRELVGCPFQPRCDRAFEPCPTVKPRTAPDRPGHSAACHLNDPAVRAAS